MKNLHLPSINILRIPSLWIKWISLACLLFSFHASLAVTKTWTGGAFNPFWSSNANWSPSGAPAAGDDVIIPSGGLMPAITSAVSARSVRVEAGANLAILSGSLTISGATDYALENLGTVSVASTGSIIVNNTTNNDGIFNSGSMANAGTITTGNLSNTDDYGIRNEGTFLNQSGATINIDLSDNGGIYNFSGTFTNQGNIRIGSNASPGIYGIHNVGNFINDTGASLRINGSTSRGFYNNGGSLTNRADLRIGNISSPGIHGIHNLASGSILNESGHIRINRTTTNGINNIATFNNDAQITIGGGASVGNNGLRNGANGATFNNNSGAQLTINRSTSNGINNNGGTFTNNASITIGSTNSVGANGIRNAASFTNGDGGTIDIDRSTTNGIYNTSGTFSHLGTGTYITIGGNAAVGDYGIQNNGTFNATDGSPTNTIGHINIDRSTSSGIYNTGTYLCDGTTINIGANNSVGQYGIHNTSLFNTGGSGKVYIDRSSSAGLYNESGTFSHATATLSIGSSASVGNYGLHNKATFTNTGLVQINRTSSSGLYNESGTFTSKVDLEIGQLAGAGNVSGPGINNQAIFNNDSTGSISISNTGNDGISNQTTGTFSNSATLLIGQTGGSGSIANHGIDNQGSFTNSGTGMINIDNLGASGIRLTAGTFSNGARIDIDKSGSYGLYIPAGTFNNSDTLNIGQSGGAGNISTFGIYTTSQATVNNNSGGVINIDNLGESGVFNALGTFNNAATLNIGQSGGADNIRVYGVYNSGIFTNSTGGEINVDNVELYEGIRNGNTFTNAATINIGQNGGAGSIAASGIFNFTAFSTSSFTNSGVIDIDNTSGSGIYTQTAFHNNTGGIINIDNTNNHGINSADTFTNVAFINIGQNGGAGNIGGDGIKIATEGKFNNNVNGVVNIDNTTDDGIHHGGNFFLNGASLNIGQKGSIGRHGLDNRGASLDNNGVINIDNTTLNGIHNLSTFYNTASLNIGQNGPGMILNYGINNSYVFMNSGGGVIDIDHTVNNGILQDGFFQNSDGVIHVDNTGEGALLNLGGEFINADTLNIGQNGGASSIYGSALENQDSFKNDTTGVINLDNGTIARLRNNDGGTFTNIGALNIGKNGGSNVRGIYNYDNATFTNNNVGVINIDHAVVGIYNQATFNNASAINIGQNGGTGSIDSLGIRNLETFNNNSGEIMIDRSTLGGIFHESGAFANVATITLGANASVGTYGIRTQAPFFQDSSGVLNIDSTTAAGILLNGDTLTNQGHISIGANTRVIGFGIDNHGATFINDTDGMIQIDRADYAGISSENGSFINRDTISLGGNTIVGDDGITNISSLFFNHVSGVILIDNTANNGIYCALSGSVFDNAGTITIGENASVGNYGIQNLASASFHNSGNLSITNTTNRAIHNPSASTFTNTGRLEGTGTYSLSGDALAGTVAPGLSPGSMSYTSSQTFTATNTLEIEVNGTTPNSLHDQIVVADTLTLSGTLSVTISYSPTIGDLITILDAAVLSGTFSSHNLPTGWWLSYNTPNAGEVSLVYTDKISWTGSVDSAWHKSGNWQYGIVPTSDLGALIPPTANDPVITGNEEARFIVLDSAASLTLNAGSSLALTSTQGIAFDSEGTLTNHGTLTISATNGTDGLINNGSVQNHGNLTIDGPFNKSVYNLQPFTNTGTLTIGTTDGGSFGIWNESTYTNTSGGVIEIDNINDRGLNNLGTFTNTAKLNIGQNGGVDNIFGTGIQSSGTFNNNSGGAIRIDNVIYSGLANVAGTFSNSDTLSIGQNGSIGGAGISNQSTFLNNTGGDINLDSTGGHGIFNSGTFTNTATLRIGQNGGGVNSDGINNQGTFLNHGGGIDIGQTGSAGINNTDIFVNDSSGTMNIDNVQSSAIQNQAGNFTNSAILSIGLNGGANNISQRGIVNLSAFTNLGGLINIMHTGGEGISNAFTFSNTSGGIIHLNNIGAKGIFNSAGFTNRATLNIGQTGGSGNISSHGIENAGNFFNVGGTIDIDQTGGSGIENTYSFTNDSSGIINIDQVAQTGLYIDGVFNNKALIHIGDSASVGQFGIRNRNMFHNHIGGTIQINRSTNHGIYNEFGTFTNQDTVSIGGVASIGNRGIFNEEATFQNEAGGYISLERATTSAIDNEDVFFNSGAITIGANHSAGTYGIRNESSFQNDTGATLRIDSTSQRAIFNASGTFTNKATIILGAKHEIGLYGIWKEGDFTNDTLGVLSIDRVGSFGISNEEGTLTNNGSIIIGSVGNGGSTGILNLANWNNNSTSDISINRVNFCGIINSGGTFHNASTINIGNSSALGDYGIRNSQNALFNNNIGGDIQIDSTTFYGIRNENSTFNNEATLIIGANSSVGNHGIYTSQNGIFNNHSGGNISIERATSRAIFNESGVFNNAAAITIGASVSPGDYGIYNEDTFSNNIGGSISIDRANSTGIVNFGVFTNQDTITIGANGSIGYYGITIGNNFESATFNNNGILSIQNTSIYSIDKNNGSYINTGLLKGIGTYDLAGSVLDGIVAPGTSPGAMDYTGSQTFTPANTLEIEVEGTTPETQHDVITVVDTATIGGTLSVTINYLPATNDRIVFLTASNIVGTFSTINPALPADWALDYSIPGEVALVYNGVSFPVEWLSFDARPEGSTALLSWETASELNNEGFMVEHSIDGNLWIPLDFVPGMGSSSEGEQYDYTHLHPQQGVNYYRLKQIDFNGVYKYSEIRAVSMGFADSELSIYPNPSSGHIKFNQSVSGKIVIRNTLGQQIWQASGEDIQSLDLSHLAEGHYYLQHVDQGSQGQSLKFVILKN